MKAVSADLLDPALFVVSPHVAILDEFRMTNANGTFVADITPGFIDALIAHMNERETLTGDLCPLVIGHTMDGVAEVDQPPLVGYARNWHKGILGETGRQCAFFDAWVFKDQVERVRKYPRRSGEVWASRYEIDPISLLGATTPARDLGLLKLSRDGSFTYNAPGDMTMPDEKKDDKKTEPKKDGPAADPKESGAAKSKEGKEDQILQLLGEILAVLKPAGGAPAGAAPAGAPAPDAGAGAGAPGGDAPMSDEDFEKFMQEMMAGQGGEGAPAGAAPPEEESRAGDKPTKNAGGTYPGGNNTVVPMHGNDDKAKLSRLEQELADQKAEVARMKIKDTLVKLNREGRAIDPEDQGLIEDLVAMEPTLRQRQLDRLAKVPAAPGAGSVHLQRSIEGAVANGTNGKRMDRDTVQKLQRQAVEQKKSFEQVAAEAGYDLSGR